MENTAQCLLGGYYSTVKILVRAVSFRTNVYQSSRCSINLSQLAPFTFTTGVKKNITQGTIKTSVHDKELTVIAPQMPSFYVLPDSTNVPFTCISFLESSETAYIQATA